MSEAICTWPSCGHTAKGQCGLRLVFDPVTRSAVRINPPPDLPPALSAAMELPDVRALVETMAGLKRIVEEIDGAMNHGTWRDEKGMRLKDTPEWVSAYVALAAIKEPKT